MLSKHEIEWEPATREWFCVRCFLTSDHVNRADAERELSQYMCMEESPRGLSVSLRENSFRLWIIVPTDNEHIAWSGTRWIPITRDGLPAADLDVLTFATVKEAASYSQSVGFEVQHG
jgi:hypothetical protein